MGKTQKMNSGSPVDQVWGATLAEPRVDEAASMDVAEHPSLCRDRKQFVQRVAVPDQWW